MSDRDSYINLKVLSIVVSYKDYGVCVNDICDYMADLDDVVSEKQVRYHLSKWIDKGKIQSPSTETREGYFKNTLFYYPTEAGCRMVINQ